MLCPASFAARLGPSGKSGTTMFSDHDPSSGRSFSGTVARPMYDSAVRSASSTWSCTSDAPARRSNVNVSPAPRPHTASSVRFIVSVRLRSDRTELSRPTRTNASERPLASIAARCFPANTHTCTRRALTPRGRAEDARTSAPALPSRSFARSRRREGGEGERARGGSRERVFVLPRVVGGGDANGQHAEVFGRAFGHRVLPRSFRVGARAGGKRPEEREAEFRPRAPPRDLGRGDQSAAEEIARAAPVAVEHGEREAAARVVLRGGVRQRDEEATLGGVEGRVEGLRLGGGAVPSGSPRAERAHLHERVRVRRPVRPAEALARDDDDVGVRHGRERGRAVEAPAGSADEEEDEEEARRGGFVACRDLAARPAAARAGARRERLARAVPGRHRLEPTGGRAAGRARRRRWGRGGGGGVGDASRARGLRGADRLDRRQARRARGRRVARRVPDRVRARGFPAHRAHLRAPRERARPRRRGGGAREWRGIQQRDEPQCRERTDDSEPPAWFRISTGTPTRAKTTRNLFRLHGEARLRRRRPFGWRSTARAALPPARATTARRPHPRGRSSRTQRAGTGDLWPRLDSSLRSRLARASRRPIDAS